MVQWLVMGIQLGQESQDIVMPQPAGRLDRTALPSVFIDHGEHPEYFGVMCPGLDEIIGLDIVALAWPQTDS